MEHHRDFDQIAQEYDFWMSTVNDPAHYLGLLKLLPADTASVLDVGCGAGQLALFLADFADQVTGLDISSAMIDRAKQGQAEQHKENIEFLVGDIETYAVDHTGYDLVVSDYALHNTDLERALPNLRRLVRPGGRLFVRDLVTDDAQRWQSATWQRWRALQDAPALCRQHGWQAMGRILRFRLGSAWVEHVRHDKILKASVAQAIYRRFFQGCVLRVEGQEMTLLWEAPPPALVATQSADTQPESQPTRISDQPRFQPPPPWPEERFPKSQAETSIVQVFEARVAQHGDRQAIRAGDKTLTYAELNAAANRLAREIVQRCGTVEEPVAILLSQDTSILVALFAALKAGKAYVVLDSGQPAERLREFLFDVQARIVVTAAWHLDDLAALVPADCHIVNMEQLDPNLSADNLDVRITPDHLAGIFYTSGSTGEPKGILRQHRQILHSTWHNTNAYKITFEDRHSLLGFCGHTATVPDIFDSLLNGATLCLFEPGQHSLSEMSDWLLQEKITLFHPPVELFRRFLTALHGVGNFPHIRMVILAGQTVLPQDVTQYRSHFRAECLLLHRLASTETGSVAHLLIDRGTPIGDRVPVGYATADKEILILDEARQPVGVGEIGEIAIRSRYLASGYWRQPELTAAKFIADPGGGDERVYLTGDMGQLAADGLLEHLGRKDLLVKIRGYRVQLEAVEAALRALSFVHEAAVGVYEAAGSSQRLVGYIVPKAAHSPSASDLRWQLSRSLPDYMIPTAWVMLSELPMTATGKVDRRSLPLPNFTRPDLDTPFVAPRNELEQQLAVIWAELLELDKVGVEDNFFELGGDSILAMRMVLAVERATGRAVPTEFFPEPTVAKLVEKIVLSVEASHSTAILTNLKQSTGSSRNQARSFRRRLRAQMIEVGPQWRRHALPYGLGVRLQRLLVAQPFVRQCYARQLALVERWSEELGIDGDSEERLTISLLANTWVEWRKRALSHPGNSGAWYNVNDPYHVLADSLTSSAGIVLAVPHVGRLGTELLELWRLSGRETSMVVGGAQVGTKRRSEMLLHALRILRWRGVVMVAADGLQGNQSVDVPFWGRCRPFQIGAAELAVTTGAAFVPVYFRFEPTGRIEVEIAAPIIPQMTTPQTQIRELTERYGTDYAARWPQFFASMRWHHLAYNLDRPEW
ncbi:AMP-binding protein [Candidatus Chloroploca sp. Khr17]|uniref:AMP-binding protein n=1 Tax=Candidatus Chloroploca sp. Khr17 TaxID=2496869 RepID=UPI00101C59E5|nr:AMP-binding protein [Candidatus Chloroploca sp. Khr17]